jgi:hypothetical protein
LFNKLVVKARLTMARLCGIGKTCGLSSQGLAFGGRLLSLTAWLTLKLQQIKLLH